MKTFANKVYGDMAGAMAVGMAYVGVKMGLFRTMAGKGHVRADEVESCQVCVRVMSRSG